MASTNAPLTAGQLLELANNLYPDELNNVTRSELFDEDATGDGENAMNQLMAVDDECSRASNESGATTALLRVLLPVRRRIDEVYSEIVYYVERHMRLGCVVSGAMCYYPGMRILDGSQLHCAIDQCWFFFGRIGFLIHFFINIMKS